MKWKWNEFADVHRYNGPLQHLIEERNYLHRLANGCTQIDDLLKHFKDIDPEGHICLRWRPIPGEECSAMFERETKRTIGCAAHTFREALIMLLDRTHEADGT